MTLGDWNEYGRLVIADMEENRAFRSEVRESLGKLEARVLEQRTERNHSRWFAGIAVPAIVAVFAAWVTAFFTK